MVAGGWYARAGQTSAGIVSPASGIGVMAYLAAYVSDGNGLLAELDAPLAYLLRLHSLAASPRHRS